MKHQINTPPSSNGSAAAINGKMLGAALLIGSGVWLWPSTTVDWGWGLLAIMLWLSAFGMFIEVIRLAVKIYMRDRALSKFTAQGHQPKSAELASSNALKDAGMTDG